MSKPKVQTRKVWVILDSSGSPYKIFYGLPKEALKEMYKYSGMEPIRATLTWTAKGKGRRNREQQIHHQV